jgi:hypothetical protein
VRVHNRIGSLPKFIEFHVYADGRSLTGKRLICPVRCQMKEFFFFSYLAGYDCYGDRRLNVAFRNFLGDSTLNNNASFKLGILCTLGSQACVKLRKQKVKCTHVPIFGILAYYKVPPHGHQMTVLGEKPSWGTEVDRGCRRNCASYFSRLKSGSLSCFAKFFMSKARLPWGVIHTTFRCRFKKVCHFLQTHLRSSRT